jgi:hypothetical protein
MLCSLEADPSLRKPQRQCYSAMSAKFYRTVGRHIPAVGTVSKSIDVTCLAMRPGMLGGPSDEGRVPSFGRSMCRMAGAPLRSDARSSEQIAWNRLMPFRETVAVYCQNHTEHTIKQVVRIVTTGLQRATTLTAEVFRSRIFVTGSTAPLSRSQDGAENLSMRVGLNTRPLWRWVMADEAAPNILGIVAQCLHSDTAGNWRQDLGKWFRVWIIIVSHTEPDSLIPVSNKIVAEFCSHPVIFSYKERVHFSLCSTHIIKCINYPYTC